LSIQSFSPLAAQPRVWLVYFVHFVPLYGSTAFQHCQIKRDTRTGTSPGIPTVVFFMPIGYACSQFNEKVGGGYVRADRPMIFANRIEYCYGTSAPVL